MTPMDLGAAPEAAPAEAAALPEPALPEPMPAEERKRGLGRLLLSSVFWPHRTFAYVRDHGGRSWLAPLLLAVLLAVAGRAVALPIALRNKSAPPRV